MSGLIERARAAGVELSVSGDRLTYSAPPGAMTPELLAEIREHKPTLIEQLQAPDALADVVAYFSGATRGPCSRCGGPVTRHDGFRNAFDELVHLRCPITTSSAPAP